MIFRTTTVFPSGISKVIFRTTTVFPSGSSNRYRLYTAAGQEFRSVEVVHRCTTCVQAYMAMLIHFLKVLFHSFCKTIHDSLSFRCHFALWALIDLIKTWKVPKFWGPENDPKMTPKMSTKLDPSERSNSFKTLWIPCVSEHLGSPKGRDQS